MLRELAHVPAGMEHFGRSEDGKDEGEAPRDDLFGIDHP